MRFVVIGGDAAGMSAASRFKRNMPDSEVIVLEKSGDVSYSACGMPYNIADPERAIEDLVVRKAEVFREKQHIDLRTGHRAEDLDRENRLVSGRRPDGNAFSIPYDNLLMATGASPIMPDLPGFDFEGVMGLKTLEDGRRLKNFIRVRKVKSVVIIGMGYIALEMCETLRERGIEVSMVKPRPMFLPWMHPDLSQVVQEEVEGHGVNLHLGLEIQAVEKGRNDALNVICEGIALQGEMVLVAIGVTPNSRIAADAGLELGPHGAISVNRHLVSSDPNIFAAGDCADAFHVVTGKKTWIPLALRANRAGWAVADNLSGKKTALEGVAGTAVFRVFDLQVARTGLNAQEAKDAGFDPVEVTIKGRSRAHAHPGSTTIHCQMVADKTSGRLLGSQLVGMEGAVHRINALAVALHQHMTVEEFSQCDLAYAPPFGPVWDPLLTTANQLLKKL
ncbi:MAG: FAD-dependent oxidoreductase [Deltaproteobacteria bacterium]